jgi:SRSO17 transposase
MRTFRPNYLSLAPSYQCKLENCLVSVYLAVARSGYKTLIDFDLFLPEPWAADRSRYRAAGIPEALRYRPKGMIALGQLDRAKANGVKLDRLTFGEEYGKSPGFLAGLNERHLRFVGEVPRTLSCLVVNRHPGSHALVTPGRFVCPGRRWQSARRRTALLPAPRRA